MSLDLDKLCPSCETVKSLTAFYKRPNGKPAGYCKDCHNGKAKEKLKESDVRARKNRTSRSWHKRRRQSQDPQTLAKIILKDCKGSDRKHQREHDLDLATVLKQIIQPCTYCGETTLRMTLDRIDNERGHTKDNVVGACIRCNYTRGAMPYEAWVLVAVGMLAAREAGVFGDWTGRCR